MRRAKGERSVGRGWALSGLAASMLCAACIDPPSEATARLAEVHREGMQMERALDSLEERFLGAHASRAMWQELARRHGSVSEVACQNLSEHVKGMVRSIEHQQVKTRNVKRRIASATGLGGGLATTSAKLRN